MTADWDVFDCVSSEVLHLHNSGIHSVRTQVRGKCAMCSDTSLLLTGGFQPLSFRPHSVNGITVQASTLWLLHRQLKIYVGK